MEGESGPSANSTGPGAARTDADDVLDVDALLGDIREALLSPETAEEAKTCPASAETSEGGEQVSERRSALASLLLLSTSPQPTRLRAIVDERLIAPLLHTVLSLPPRRGGEHDGSAAPAAAAPQTARDAAASTGSATEAGLLRAAALSVLANLAREPSCARALVLQGALPALVGCALGTVGTLAAGSTGYMPGTKVLALFQRLDDERWTTAAYPALVLEVEGCDSDSSDDGGAVHGGAGMGEEVAATAANLGVVQWRTARGNSGVEEGRAVAGGAAAQQAKSGGSTAARATRRALQRREVRGALTTPSGAAQARYRLLFADGDIADRVPIRRLTQALDDLSGADGQLDGTVAVSGLGNGAPACPMLLSQTRLARLLTGQPVEQALLLAHAPRQLPAGGGARAASAAAATPGSAPGGGAFGADTPLPLMHHSDLVTVGLPGKPRPARAPLWSATECAHARAVAGGAAFAQRVAAAALASLLAPLPLGSAERRTFIHSGALEVLLALAHEGTGAAPLRDLEAAADAEEAKIKAEAKAKAAEKRQCRREAQANVEARRAGKRVPRERLERLTAAEEAQRLQLGMSEAEFREELRAEAEAIAREEEEFARSLTGTAQGAAAAAEEEEAAAAAATALAAEEERSHVQQGAHAGKVAAAEHSQARQVTLQGPAQAPASVLPDAALRGARSLDLLRCVAPPTGADGVGGEGASILCALARRTLGSLTLAVRCADLRSLQLARAQRERGGGDALSFVAGDALASDAAGLPLKALLRPRGLIWHRSGAAAKAMAVGAMAEQEKNLALAAQQQEARQLAKDRAVPLDDRLGAVGAGGVTCGAPAAAAGMESAALASALPADPTALAARLQWRGTELGLLRTQRDAEAAICGAVLATPGGADFGAWRHAHPAAAERRRAAAEAAEVLRCGAKQRRAQAEACEVERAAMEWDEATLLRLERVLHPAESETQRQERLKREAGQRAAMRVRKAAKASAAEERKRLLWKKQQEAAEVEAEADMAALAAATARNVAVVQADAAQAERESAGGAIEQAEAERYETILNKVAEDQVEQACRDMMLQEDERARQVRLRDNEARERAAHEAREKKRLEAAARKAKRKAKREKQAAKEAVAEAKQHAEEAAAVAAAELAHKREVAAANKATMQARLAAMEAKKQADKPPLPARPPDVERYVPREVLCRVERFYEKDDGEGGIVLENNMDGERWHVSVGADGTKSYTNRATGAVSTQAPRPKTKAEREQEKKEKEAAAVHAAAASAEAAAEAAAAATAAAAAPAPETEQEADDAKWPMQEQIAGEDAAVTASGGTLPGGWEVRADGDGNTYYENTTSGMTQWELPADMPA